MSNEKEHSATMAVASSTTSMNPPPAKSISIGIEELAVVPELKDDEVLKQQELTIAGLAEWIDLFYLPAKRRKHPSVTFSIANGNSIEISTSDHAEAWLKDFRTATKKIVVEVLLSNVNASELYDSIPIEDTNKRGRQDLEVMEKDLSVKVVFLEKHVLLVGAKTKLAKKCFTIRNVISHYHWRLSGRES